VTPSWRHIKATVRIYFRGKSKQPKAHQSFFWRCIEISANGWRIAEDPPVRFHRSAGMQPLPLPVRGGSIEALAPFVNFASDSDFVLVVAWVLGALRAGGPYPVLAIAGEQGISEDRPLEAPAGADRPQRGAGAGAPAR